MDVSWVVSIRVQDLLQSDVIDKEEDLQNKLKGPQWK